MATQPYSSTVVSHCFRLKPGQDLKMELIRYCQEHNLYAACVVSSVGSLEKATLRLADGKEVTEFLGPFEIVSLTGTLSSESGHFHISLSNTQGAVIGGHLMNGCIIKTTAEIVLLENSELQFVREFDGSTGYKELVVRKRSSQ